jgi:hypothetical protein
MSGDSYSEPGKENEELALSVIEKDIVAYISGFVIKHVKEKTSRLP